MTWPLLGLSTNLDARASPNPYRLFDRWKRLFDYVEYSAPVDVEEARRDASLFDEMFARRAELPALFHPVHLNLYGPTLESREALRKLDEHARAVGSPWVGNDVAWWHEGGNALPGYLYISPPLDSKGLDDCVRHAEHVQSHLSMPLLLENPAIVARRGELHVLDFMAELHQRTGLGLILDLGHLLSHQLAYGLPLTTGLDGFPFEAVTELHLAGGVVSKRGDRRFYFDDHTQPLREEVFELLKLVLPRSANLRAVTFEGDGLPDENAESVLNRIRLAIAERDGLDQAEKKLDAPPRKAIAARDESFTAASNPWRLFDESHGRAVGADSEGDAADLEMRLAVLAEKLDAAFPLSRPLLGPEALKRFISSDHFRDTFQPEGKSLLLAYAAWARQEVRAFVEKGDDALASALSFEIWAHRSAHTHPRAAPAKGEMVMAAGWAVAAFPMDFSEALFAARALKRHSLARAWASGELPSEATEGIAHALRRKSLSKTGWNLALRFTGDALSVIPLSQPEATILSAAQRPTPLTDAPEVRSLVARGLLRIG
ncbi:MAG: DUF692 family multinuclear iron-containing protein [Myxococcaceae bacterium]